MIRKSLVVMLGLFLTVGSVGIAGWFSGEDEWTPDSLRFQSCNRIAQDSFKGIFMLLDDVKEVKNDDGSPTYHCWAETYAETKCDPEGIYHEDDASKNVHGLLEVAVINGRSWYVVKKIIDMLKQCQERNYVKEALEENITLDLFHEQDERINRIIDLLLYYENHSGRKPYKELAEQLVSEMNLTTTGKIRELE